MPIVAQVRDVAHGPLVYICVILQLFVRFIYILYCREIITFDLLPNMPVITSINQLKQDIRTCREIAIQRFGYKHHVFVGIVDEYGCDLYQYSCNLESAIEFNGLGKITRIKLYFEKRSCEEILKCNFDKGDKLYLIQRDDYPNDEEAEKNCIKRAQLRVGEQEYFLVNNNCESYVNWIFANDSASKQITTSIMNRTVGNAFDGMFSTGTLRPLLHLSLFHVHVEEPFDKDEDDEKEYESTISCLPGLRYEEKTLKLPEIEEEADMFRYRQSEKEIQQEKHDHRSSKELQETNESIHMKRNSVQVAIHPYRFEEENDSFLAKRYHRNVQAGNDNHPILLGVLFLSISIQQYYGNYTPSSKYMIHQNEEVFSNEVALYVDHSLTCFDTSTWEEFAENLQSLFFAIFCEGLLFYWISIRQIYAVIKSTKFTLYEKKNIIAKEVCSALYGVAGSVLVQLVIPKSCFASLVCGMAGHAIGGIIGDAIVTLSLV